MPAPKDSIKKAEWIKKRTQTRRENGWFKKNESWKVFFQSLLSERYGYEHIEDQKIVLDFMEPQTGLQIDKHM